MHIKPAPMSLRGRTSSAFYTHGTRTSTMFVKEEHKFAISCLSASKEEGSSCFFAGFNFRLHSKILLTICLSQIKLKCADVCSQAI